MADLITLVDVTSRMPEALNAGQAARAPALIRDASALVRRFVPGLSSETDVVVVLELNANRLTLPTLPVISVSSVVQIGFATPLGDILIPPGAWRFNGIDQIILDEDASRWIINLSEGWWGDDPTATYRVTYSHGFATLPDDVIMVVANMVIRVLTSPSVVGGLTGENIGQYGYQMSQQQGTEGSGVRLTENDKIQLGFLRRRSMSIETPIS